MSCLSTEPLISLNNDVYHHRISAAHNLNKTLLSGFLKWQNHKEIRKTHLFEGRYENIYITAQHIPELRSLIKSAIASAETILNVRQLRAGYWFNYMPAGSTTTLHTHDDDDELLSAVYYVHALENSGNLIIHIDDSSHSSKTIEIQPEAGKFVFFKPTVPHEVNENQSTEHRLSIGINFGLDKD